MAPVYATSGIIMSDYAWKESGGKKDGREGAWKPWKPLHPAPAPSSLSFSMNGFEGGVENCIPQRFPCVEVPHCTSYMLMFICLSASLSVFLSSRPLPLLLMTRGHGLPWVGLLVLSSWVSPLQAFLGPMIRTPLAPSSPRRGEGLDDRVGHQGEELECHGVLAGVGRSRRFAGIRPLCPLRGVYPQGIGYVEYGACVPLFLDIAEGEALVWG